MSRADSIRQTASIAALVTVAAASLAGRQPRARASRSGRRPPGARAGSPDSRRSGGPRSRGRPRRAPVGPLDRLLLRPHLDHPVAADDLLGLGEGSVGYAWPCPPGTTPAPRRRAGAGRRGRAARRPSSAPRCTGHGGDRLGGRHPAPSSEMFGIMNIMNRMAALLSGFLRDGAGPVVRPRQERRTGGRNRHLTDSPAFWPKLFGPR